jgi:CpXC protein
MSIFKPVSLNCPHCGKPVDFQASASVNADRRPDIRAAILDGSFQRQDCPHCGVSFRAEPQLNYFDIGRGQWLGAMPVDWLDQWPELEQTTADAFAKAFGEQASEDAQEIGAGLKPRLVFGWRGLVEKLLADEAGLDDVTLELTKLSLMAGLEDEPLEVGQQLRLTGVDAEFDTLSLLIVGRDGGEDEGEELTVPKALYEEIMAEPEDWQVLREQLVAGLFVDVARITRGSSAAD